MAPVITIPYTEHTFNATDSNRITCTAEGYPTPDIIWLNNNGSEVDKDRLITSIVMATGVGNITNKSVAISITRDDGGVYTCIASNSVDSDTSIINIAVQCKFILKFCFIEIINSYLQQFQLLPYKKNIQLLKVATSHVRLQDILYQLLYG